MEVRNGENSPGDKVRELDHGERGGTVGEEIREGVPVLLYGSDPREDVGKRWFTVGGMARLVSAEPAWKDGERMIDKMDELGWWTEWLVEDEGKAGKVGWMIRKGEEVIRGSER